MDLSFLESIYWFFVFSKRNLFFIFQSIIYSTHPITRKKYYLEKRGGDTKNICFDRKGLKSLLYSPLLSMLYIIHNIGQNITINGINWCIIFTVHIVISINTRWSHHSCLCYQFEWPRFHSAIKRYSYIQEIITKKSNKHYLVTNANQNKMY